MGAKELLEISDSPDFLWRPHCVDMLVNCFLREMVSGLTQVRTNEARDLGFV